MLSVDDLPRAVRSAATPPASALAIGLSGCSPGGRAVTVFGVSRANRFRNRFIRIGRVYLSFRRPACRAVPLVPARHGLVRIVEGTADLRAQRRSYQRAERSSDQLSTTGADLSAEQPTGSRAENRAASLLRSVGLTSRDRQRAGGSQENERFAVCHLSISRIASSQACSLRRQWKNQDDFGYALSEAAAGSGRYPRLRRLQRHQLCFTMMGHGPGGRRFSRAANALAA